MKKIIVLILIFLVTLLRAQNTRHDVMTVLGNMEKQEMSWNKGDIAGFMDFYWHSDSLKFIGSKGITYGWQKTLSNYLNSYPSKEAMGILKFTNVEATQLSDSAIYVIGKWELNKEKMAGGYFTLLWCKIDNKWVIVSDHTS
ncbi:MAG: hypothetical protein K0R26_475 [Bacteroidota bacterium]|jgi:hypothetical protein|nr:hypothetical protein [Bacteroidota bacterium]